MTERKDEMTNRFISNRSRLEIIHEILSICNARPVKKTHILYKANMSFNQLQRYIAFLIEKQLLEEDTTGKGKKYYANHKGKRFMNEFQKLQNLLLTPSKRVGNQQPEPQLMQDFRSIRKLRFVRR